MWFQNFTAHSATERGIFPGVHFPREKWAWPSRVGSRKTALSRKLQPVSGRGGGGVFLG